MHANQMPSLTQLLLFDPTLKELVGTPNGDSDSQRYHVPTGI
jgi:hypothetical protein